MIAYNNQIRIFAVFVFIIFIATVTQAKVITTTLQIEEPEPLSPVTILSNGSSISLFNNECYENICAYITEDEIRITMEK